MFTVKVETLNNFTHVIENVSNIQLCNDGRHLITYFSNSENQDMIWQIPKSYIITSQWVD